MSNRAKIWEGHNPNKIYHMYCSFQKCKGQTSKMGCQMYFVLSQTTIFPLFLLNKYKSALLVYLSIYVQTLQESRNSGERFEQEERIMVTEETCVRGQCEDKCVRAGQVAGCHHRCSQGGERWRECEWMCRMKAELWALRPRWKEELVKECRERRAGLWQRRSPQLLFSVCFQESWGKKEVPAAKARKEMGLLMTLSVWQEVSSGAVL